MLFDVDVEYVLLMNGAKGGRRGADGLGINFESLGKNSGFFTGESRIGGRGTVPNGRRGSKYKECNLNDRSQ